MKKQYLSAFALALFASTAFAQTNPVRTVDQVAVPTENTTGKDVYIVLGNNLAARINTDGGQITGQAAGSPVRIVTVNATAHVYKIYDVKSGKWFANKGGATAPKADDQVTLSDTPSEWYIYNNNNGGDATLLDIAPKVGSAAITDGTIASWNFYQGYAAGKHVGYWDANDGNSAWRLYDPKALVKSSVAALAAVDSSAAAAANNAIDAASDEAGYAAALKAFRQALDDHQVRFANTGRGAKNYLTLSTDFKAGATETKNAEDVFVLKYHADNDNFSLQHAVTGRNLANVPGRDQAIPSTTSDATRYDLLSNGKNNTISLRNVSINADLNYLHLAGDKVNVVRWEAGSGDANNASTWTIENADDIDDSALLAAAQRRFALIPAPGDLGEQLGQRTFTDEVDELVEKLNDNEALTLEEYQQLLSAHADNRFYELNMPGKGLFFKIKSNDGTRYVTATGATDGAAWQLKTTTDSTDEGTIFGYDGSHLVSLSTGRAVYLSGGSQAKLADYTVTNFGTVEFGATPDNKYAVYVKQGGQTATMHLWQDNRTGVDGSNGKNTGHVLTHLQLEEVESVPVHLNTAGLATFVPADDMVVPDGVEIYVASQYDTAHQRIILSQLEGKVIPADTPVLLYGHASTTIQLTYSDEEDGAPTVSVNAFQGRFTPSAVPAGQEGRVLNGGEFVQVVPSNVRGMRAFVSAAPSAGTRTALAFPGVTAVESVKTASESEAPIYDLSGRRVTKPVAGQIYVQNGKKFLQR